MILYLRSFAFNLVWYLNLLVQMIVQFPFYIMMDHDAAVRVCRRWCLLNHPLHRWLAGTEVRITGKENLPKEGGYIVASKHQSIWEFYALWAELPDPAFVLKAELLKIPLFGWFVAKVDQIPIKRGEKGKALRAMLIKAKEVLDSGRQILIFPEGTRKRAGAEPDYRYGITRMYLELNCPVVPAALVSGLYWPRRKFLRYPGILRAEFLEPIMPGLSGPEFSAELQRRIEEACDRLYLESSLDEQTPPLNEDVKAAIERAKSRLDVQAAQ